MCLKSVTMTGSYTQTPSPSPRLAQSTFEQENQIETPGWEGQPSDCGTALPTVYSGAQIQCNFSDCPTASPSSIPTAAPSADRSANGAASHAETVRALFEMAAFVRNGRDGNVLRLLETFARR